MNPTHTSSAPGAARTFEIAVTRTIPAPPDAVYGVFADYRVAHPRVLPPRFFTGLKVEEGGHGAGTVVMVEGRFAGRTRTMRGVVTEPEPGRLLVESYPADQTVTSFHVAPAPGNSGSTVTISTIMNRRRGIVGWIEERVVRRLLEGVYTEELDLVRKYLADHGA